MIMHELIISAYYTTVHNLFIIILLHNSTQPVYYTVLHTRQCPVETVLPSSHVNFNIYCIQQ